MGQEEGQVGGEAMDDAEPQGVATAQPFSDEEGGVVMRNERAPLAPADGGRVLFYESNWEARGLQPSVATINRVWSSTCVNLDNGNNSVFVFDGRDEVNRPGGHYCVLLNDEEAELFGRLALYEEQPPALVARANFTRIERAQELPEVPVDADLYPIEYEPGSIEQFKSVDRRTMRIVAIGYPAGFAQQAVEYGMKTLPVYQCHKQVQACKIEAVLNGCDGWEILPADRSLDAIRVPYDYVQRHRPQPGGYYVLYRDGYSSYSPAKEFEDGYAPLEGLAARRAELEHQLDQVNRAIAAQNQGA